jgi:hypothetical protein
MQDHEHRGKLTIRGQGYESFGYAGPSPDEMRAEQDRLAGQRAEQRARELASIQRAVLRAGSGGAAPATAPDRWIFQYIGYGMPGGRVWEVRRLAPGEHAPAGAVLLRNPPSQAVLEGREYPPEIYGA